VATSGADDACGVYGVGRITGSGTGTGVGAFLDGRRDTNTGKALGLEISCANYTASAGSYNSTGFSDTSGLWVEANGNSDSGVGISFGNPFGFQYDVGIGFTAQVVGGKTGGIISQSIRDDSTAATSIQINGTHATAAIAIAQNAGGIKIGSITAMTAGRKIEIGGTSTGSTDTRVVFSGPTIQSDVTAQSIIFGTNPGTAATAFTLTTLKHFEAAQGTIGAASAVTNQFGFVAQSTLTGATNNYGFYGNIASAANRWNFFANGTADNAFVGNIRIGSTTAPTVALDVTGAGKISTTLTVTGAFGCNTKAAQTAFASGGALNAYGAGANGLDTGANMSSLHALVVAMRAALVANGIMS
jgi:hypothetical protein